jgi:hypothetical protein
MKTVARAQMIEVWDRLCKMDQPQTEALVKKFMDEQPALGLYLFASLEELEGEAEQTRVTELVVAAWQAMSKAAGRRLPVATPEDIESAEETNTMRLEKLEEGSEMDWEDAVRDSFQDYNQRELLGFGIEVLMSGNEETPEPAPESIGMELIWLKTVIDVLDR